MSGHKSFKILGDRIDADPERRARVEELERTYDEVLALADLRESRGVTQTQLAESLGVSQPNVSKVEHTEDIRLSTIIHYVAALGGHLELKAVFPNEKVNLTLPREGQQEASETLSQEATNAYSEFLNSALSFYQEAMSTASQVAQGNMQNAAQATQQGMKAASQAGQQAVQAATQAGQQTAQAGTQTAQQGAESANQSAQQDARGGEQIAQSGAYAAQRVATGVHIRDYDNLKVGEIVEQLDSLSAEELQAARTYEKQNKNRDTLIEQIDRRINAAS